jgi:hypothetical protein
MTSLGTAQAEVGQYIANPAATSTVLTLPGSSPNATDWTVKVRSEVAGEDLSTPFPLSTVRTVPSRATVRVMQCWAHCAALARDGVLRVVRSEASWLIAGGWAVCRVWCSGACFQRDMHVVNTR